jgi:hypothetical protein
MTRTPARRRGTPAAALLALAALLTACTPAGGGAGRTPNPAASAVTAEICELVKDGQVSPAEVEALDRVLDRAHSLGLPDDILDPAHEIATDGAATPETIAELRKACA